MTADEALERTRELLRAIADLTEDPTAFVEVETQVSVVDALAAADFKTEDDETLAVYGTVAALYRAEGQLPELLRRRLERDISSVLHDIGRWHAVVFHQPAFEKGRHGGRHITELLDEAANHAQALSGAIDHLLGAEPEMESGLRAALRNWIHALDGAVSEIRRHEEDARDDPEIFWAGQMIADACYDLAKVAWGALAVFGYSATSRDPHAERQARQALIEAARATGRFIDGRVGRWRDAA